MHKPTFTRLGGTLRRSGKNLLKALVWPVLLHAFVLALRLAAWVKPFRVGYVFEERIGHLTSELDILLRRRDLTMPNHDKPVLVFTGKACNPWVPALFRQHVTIIENRLFRTLILEGARDMLRQAGLWVELRTDTNEFVEYAQARGRARLPEAAERKAASMLRDMGIPDGAWWVCFHARDKMAISADVYPYDHSYHDYRNFSIHSMTKAMEYIAGLGGYAIRMGASPEERQAEGSHPNIIDYANTHRDELLDIYLLSHCKFFVGCSSGLFHVPKSVDIPYLLTNLIGYIHLTPGQTSLFMPKLIRRHGGDIMTFEECAEIGMFDQHKGLDFYRSETYRERGLEIVDNDEQDILDGTRDLMRLVEGGAAAAGPSPEQAAFKDRYYGHYADRHLAGNIAPSFLERHSKILLPDGR